MQQKAREELWGMATHNCATQGKTSMHHGLKIFGHISRQCPPTENARPIYLLFDADSGRAGLADLERYFAWPMQHIMPSRARARACRSRAGSRPLIPLVMRFSSEMLS